MTFNSCGYQYVLDDYGIHQINPEPFVYTPQYVKLYNKLKYRRGQEVLQSLRLGFVIGSHGSVPQLLCDVGFGNGAFLYRCKGVIPTLYGKDISGVEVPKFVERVWNYVPCDVITFHDVLEHIHNLSFLQDLPCNTVVVTCPYCHFFSAEWFDKWKHRKPNEHLHHWDRNTLTQQMGKYGWKSIAVSTHEDIIRKGKDEPNILTMAFKR